MKKIYCKLGIALIALFVISSCTKRNANVPNPVVSVTVTSPQIKEIQDSIAANGIVNAWQETKISSQVSGLDIIAVYVNVGDSVKKGDKLVQLNADQINADLMQQVANVAEAEANLEQSRTEAQQALQLQNAGAVSKQELLNYTTKAKTNQAKLEAAKAALKLQKLKLSYTLITAPDDGIISSRTATVGSTVQIGNELFKLIRKNRLEWQAEVNPNDITRISIGQTAIINNDNGTLITGKVRQISPSLNPNTKNDTVYVDLPGTIRLKVGVYLSGRINNDIAKLMIIPTSAIINRDGYNYVMCLGPGDKVIQTKVQLGAYHEDYVVINSGLTLKDKVVTLGSGFLNDGDLVQVVPGASK